MKFFIPILATFISCFFISLGIFICWKYFNGPIFIIAFPILGIIILGITFITQLILLLLLNQVKNQVYRFFYYCCFASSLMLIGLYTLFSLLLLSLKKTSEAIDAMYPERSELAENNIIDPFFHLHLFLLVPIVIQICLIILRYRRIKKINTLIKNK